MNLSKNVEYYNKQKLLNVNQLFLKLNIWVILSVAHAFSDFILSYKQRVEYDINLWIKWYLFDFILDTNLNNTETLLFLEEIKIIIKNISICYV